MSNQQPPTNPNEPLDEGGPEWGSVEEERDYWKGLALAYGAKLGAIGVVFKVTWTVRKDAVGEWWIEQKGGDGTLRRTPLGSIEEIMKDMP